MREGKKQMGTEYKKKTSGFCHSPTKVGEELATL